MVTNPTFIFDATLCTGCKACIIACKDKHNLDIGIQWRRVLEYSGGQWHAMPNGCYEQNIFAYYISLSCNHCQEAPCIESCPSQAMAKDEYGIVRIDAERCIGCHACQKHCPYDAPQFDAKSKKMTKCDFCHDSLMEGKAPTCVEACPCRALNFGSYETVSAHYAHIIAAPAMAPLPDASMTKPHAICLPHAQARPCGSNEGIFGAQPSNPEELS